jgi:hypothetical protein
LARIPPLVIWGSQRHRVGPACDAEVIGRLFAGCRSKKRERGYSLAQAVLALCETLIAGGECLDGAGRLRGDSAQELLRGHAVPDPSTLGRFLARFSIGHIGQLNRALDRLFARGACSSSASR